MKLPAMLDQNPHHTFDKIVEKQITTKTLSKLDLEPKCQDHSRKQKTTTLLIKKLSRGSLGGVLLTPT